MVDTGNAALNYEHVLLNVHGDYPKPLHRPPFVAHLSRHTLSLLYPSGLGPATDGSRRAMKHGSVATGTAGKFVTLNNTLESLAPSRARYINQFSNLEQVNFDLLSQFRNIITNQMKLSQKPRNRHVAFLSVTLERLVNSRLLLLTEAQLYRFVTVPVIGLDLHHATWTGLDDCNGNAVSVLIENLRHSPLYAYDSFNHLSTIS